jgi:hypothetical protein
MFHYNTVRAVNSKVLFGYTANAHPSMTDDV